MRIITESQEKNIDNKLFDHTKEDIRELSILSSSLSSLVRVMTVFSLYADGREDDQDHIVPILNIMELLIKPIDFFLSNDAPIAKEEKETE
jgi:hypothetical protein